jgi:cytochrome c oxidase subunit IV
MTSRMDAHAHHADLGHEHVSSLGMYFGIFATLMALTAVTVAVAWVDLGSLNIVVALAVAVFKASLVVLYFMHLKYSSKLTWIVVGAGVFWLAILLAMTMADYLTRGWMPNPSILH